VDTPTPHQRPARADSPEVAALRRLKIEQPDLAAAVDLEIDLAALHRRVHGRISTPWLEFEPEWVSRQFAAGEPILRFGEIPFDWAELRLLFRQIADILRRHDAIEAADHTTLQGCARAGMPTPEQVSDWYAETVAPALALRAKRTTAAARNDSAGTPESRGEMFRQVLSLAARPFLSRPVELIQHRIELSAWHRPYCPFCGGEPEMAVITPAADRRMICGRCTGVWPFPPLECPFCGNDERRRIKSFASRDGRYRLYACDTCRRYVKAYDARTADRPVMLSVDSIATLPLDAAAIQKGYHG
jgi:hypothetical protein